jgi:hypothetical protein
MDKQKIIDLLGVRARIILCGGRETSTEDVSLPSEASIHSTVLLPAARGDCFTVGEETDNHRRGRALAWPMEAQSPPGGVIANGNGRVYAEAVLRTFSFDKVVDRTFQWRPDGATLAAASAEALLGDSLKGELSHETEVGLVVPDGLEEHERQAVLDACAPHGKAWLIPRSMAAAIAWCRSRAAVPLLAGQSDENNPVGHVVLIEAGYGSWAITAVPIFRITKGKKNWLVPKREAGLRRVVEGLSGWGLLARQAAHHQGRSAMTRMNDPKWVLDILDGERALGDEYLNKPMPGNDVLPGMPGLDGGKDWNEGERQLTLAVRALMSEMKSPCLGGELIGALASAKKHGGHLRAQLLSAFGLKRLDVSDMAVSAGAALAMVGRANGTPTWFETLEKMSLFYQGENEMGDPVVKWAALLPGTVMDAGGDFEIDKPILGLHVPVGMNEITLTLRHEPVDGRPISYRQTSIMQTKVCEKDTPIRIDVRAKPGQGFAHVMLRSIEPGYFAGRLDWLHMKECKEPTITYGYTLTVKLVAHPQLWTTAENELKVLREVLDGPRRESRFLEPIRAATNAMNKCVHSLNYKYRPGVAKIEADDHIYYTPVDVNGNAPTTAGNRLIKEVIDGLVGQVVAGWSKDVTKGALRLLAWLYRGCPSGVTSEVFAKVRVRDADLAMLDLHIIGLTMGDKSASLIPRYMEIMRARLPLISAPNNWLRAFRDIVRLNEHALRDVPNTTLEAIVDALLPRFSSAISMGKRSVASNCYLSILFLLKRRRYSKSFLGKDHPRYQKILDCLDALEAAKYKGKPFLTPAKQTFIDSLRRFLAHNATLADQRIGGNVEEDSSDSEGNEGA